jgi:hypothetical protein
MQHNQGPQMQNTLYFTGDVALTFPDMVAVADELITRWSGDMKDIVSNRITLVGVRYRNLNTDPYGPFFETVANVAGVNANDALPTGVCAEIKLFGTAGIPPVASYVRHAGLCDNMASGQLLTGGAITDLNTVWEGMFDGIADPLGSFSILSRTDGNVPRAAASVSAITAVQTVATIRRASSRSGTGA